MDYPYQSTVNFNTPENQTFYQQKPYQSLNHARREIRLLRVHPKRLNYFDIVQNYPEFESAPGVQAIKPTECVDAPQPPGGYPTTTPRSAGHVRASKYAVNESSLPTGWKSHPFQVSGQRSNPFGVSITSSVNAR